MYPPSCSGKFRWGYGLRVTEVRIRSELSGTSDPPMIHSLIHSFTHSFITPAAPHENLHEIVILHPACVSQHGVAASLLEHGGPRQTPQ